MNQLYSIKHLSKYVRTLNRVIENGNENTWLEQADIMILIQLRNSLRKQIREIKKF